MTDESRINKGPQFFAQQSLGSHITNSFIQEQVVRGISKLSEKVEKLLALRETPSVMAAQKILINCENNIISVIGNKPVAPAPSSKTPAVEDTVSPPSSPSPR